MVVSPVSAQKVDVWAWVPYIVAVVVTINIYFQLQHYLQLKEQAIDRQTEQLTRVASEKISEKVESYRRLLSSGYAVIQPNAQLSPQAWEEFSRALSVSNLTSGVESYMYVNKVEVRELFRYVGMIRQFEIPDFHILPRTEHATKLVVKLSHSFDTDSQITQGFDLGSIPVLKDAIPMATDFGEMQASPLFESGGQSRLIAFFESAGAMRSTTEDDIGDSWIIIITKADDLFAPVYSLASEGIGFEIMLETYEHFSLSATSTGEEGNPLIYTIPLGRDTFIKIRYLPGSRVLAYAAESVPATSLLSSIIIGLLGIVVAYLFSQLFGRTALELVASEARYSLATNSAREGVIDWQDMDKDSQHWSGVMVQKAEIVSMENRDNGLKKLLDIIHPDDRENFNNAVEEAKEKTGEIDIDFRLLDKLSTYRWFKFRAKVLFEKKNCRRLIGRVYDMQERKEAEALREKMIDNLIKSNEELERFAFVASHDLQEPLRQIRNFAELALEGVSEDENLVDIKQYLSIVVDSGCRMQDIVIDLLDYARVSGEKEELELVSCEKGLQVALDNMQDRIEALGAIITSESLPEVYARSSSIVRIFQNLVGNALKYVETGVIPEVSITAGSCELHHTIRVQDNGIGIAPEFRQEVFKPFKRLHTRSEYNGTGMGLAICKKLVEGIGGSIEIEAVADKGACFVIRIPLSNSANEEQGLACQSMEHDISGISLAS